MLLRFVQSVVRIRGLVLILLTTPYVKYAEPLLLERDIRRIKKLELQLRLINTNSSLEIINT